MSAEILIVEDDSSINNMMCEALTKHGFSCTQAFSGTEGLLNIQNKNFDIAIFDLMMPGLTGEELLAKIREFTKLPVIVVSAKVDVDSRLNLLDLGADDYLVKPFEVRELIARVEVQLRHLEDRRNGAGSDDGESEEIISAKDMQLNKLTYEVTLKGEELPLTRQEYKILELLITHPTKVFTKQEIFEFAWNETYFSEDKTINVHVSNIRSKIKKITDDEYIDTVWGIGFRLAKFK